MNVLFYLFIYVYVKIKIEALEKIDMLIYISKVAYTVEHLKLFIHLKCLYGYPSCGTQLKIGENLDVDSGHI